MENKFIITRLIDILNKNFNIPIEVCKLNIDKALSTPPFDLQAEDFILLVAFVMKEFHIKFDEKDFENYNFISICKISNVIVRKVKKV